MTGDKNGSIRIWTRDKKFLREILFPDQIDSVCFLNDKGDLLVSHSKRISKIEFRSYWTKTFDYFGVSKSSEDPELAEIAKQNESVFGDPDFIFEDDPPKRVTIKTQAQMVQVINGNKQNESQTAFLKPQQ